LRLVNLRSKKGGDANYGNEESRHEEGRRQEAGQEDDQEEVMATTLSGSVATNPGDTSFRQTDSTFNCFGPGSN
jgi:hypothetical protein